VAGRHDLASVVAFYASARGLQDGEAVPVIAATSTAANVSCILGGIVVFGDPMPRDTVGIAVPAFAFALVVVAALVHAAADARGRSTGLGPSATADARSSTSRDLHRGRPMWARARSRAGRRGRVRAAGAGPAAPGGRRAGAIVRSPRDRRRAAVRVARQLGPFAQRSQNAACGRRRRGSTRQSRRRDAPTGARSCCQAAPARASDLRRSAAAVETARVSASTPRA
jgi:hypothetical protein